MIKILHLIPNLSKGGAERLVLDIVSELSKRKDVIVQLVVFNVTNDYKSEYPYITPVVIPSRIFASVYKPWQYQVDELQRFIAGFRPDVIHAHLFEAEFVSRFVNYPKAMWFSHCHDNMVQFQNFGIRTCFSKRLLTNYYEKRQLFKRYRVNGNTRFIAISKDTKKYFEHTAPEFNTQLLPNAIDYHRFFKINDYSNGDVLRLINVGSLVDNKNQTFLIDLVKILVSRNIAVELVMLGDGVNRLMLEHKIKRDKLDNIVLLKGNVNNVEEYLWNSDIYVHSANSESLGLVLIEAMAAGLPVITLDGKGNRDLIEEGKNGYMIFEQNAEMFADKILEIWNNKQKYKEMSLYAQEYAKGYDIKEYVDKLLSLYRQALNES